jgi:hypothetical protein
MEDGMTPPSTSGGAGGSAPRAAAVHLANNDAAMAGQIVRSVGF